MASERYKSVVNGTDSEVLPILMDVHCAVDNPRILDCTYNTGKMWKGTRFSPIRMDINSQLDVDYVADFGAMPFETGSFDVIVFDPPHLPVAAASDYSSGIYENIYGVTATGDGREGENISGMFDRFLPEAKRVLIKHGIVLAKIYDITHCNRYQWQHVDFINAVTRHGMTPCDCIIKCDPRAGRLSSSTWVNVRHFRKAHCYWIVARNSNSCVCRK